MRVEPCEEAPSLGLQLPSVEIRKADDLEGACQALAALRPEALMAGRPAGLRVELPTKLELVINLKAAQSIELTIPPSIMQQAADTIQ